MYSVFSVPVALFSNFQRLAGDSRARRDSSSNILRITLFQVHTSIMTDKREDTIGRHDALSAKTNNQSMLSESIDSFHSQPLACRSTLSPAPMDVICGRGKNIAHPGNRRFHLLVSSKKQAYQHAKRREEKTNITTEILQQLRSGPEASRFLIRDLKSEEWVEVDETYAREKISHSLRSKPSEQRRKRSQEKRKTSRKAKLSAEFERLVHRVIEEQQQLLKRMIENEFLSGSRQLSSESEKINI